MDHHFASKPKPRNQRLPVSGQTVRYDGGHKRDNFLTDTLGRFVELQTQVYLDPSPKELMLRNHV